MKKNRLPFTVLISAGATREYIDPIRFISNASTGRMGYSIAEFVSKEVKKVLLISGYTDFFDEFKLGDNTKIIFVKSALEMHTAISKYIKQADIFISCAAVSDYRPEKSFSQKLKKSNKSLSIKLIQNPDILFSVKKYSTNKLLVGFALDTKDLVKNAIKKLKLKNLDLIVANDIKTIGSKYITGYIIDKYGEKQKITHLPKTQFAKILWTKIKNLYEQKFATPLPA